ncbi:TPA: M23 family metallopeptidase [Candidatus Micrarchaeota archaeon]|nr:M23 family metallopeptidase [Candidatus Micrarchaeota archaeon]
MEQENNSAIQANLSLLVFVVFALGILLFLSNAFFNRAPAEDIAVTATPTPGIQQVSTAQGDSNGVFLKATQSIQGTVRTDLISLSNNGSAASEIVLLDASTAAPVLVQDSMPAKSSFQDTGVQGASFSIPAGGVFTRSYSLEDNESSAHLAAQLHSGDEVDALEPMARVLLSAFLSARERNDFSRVLSNFLLSSASTDETLEILSLSKEILFNYQEFKQNERAVMAEFQASPTSSASTAVETLSSEDANDAELDDYMAQKNGLARQNFFAPSYVALTSIPSVQGDSVSFEVEHAPGSVLTQVVGVQPGVLKVSTTAEGDSKTVFTVSFEPDDAFLANPVPLALIKTSIASLPGEYYYVPVDLHVLDVEPYDLNSRGKTSLAGFSSSAVSLANGALPTAEQALKRCVDQNRAFLKSLNVQVDDADVVRQCSGRTRDSTAPSTPASQLMYRPAKQTTVEGGSCTVQQDRQTFKFDSSDPNGKWLSKPDASGEGVCMQTSDCISSQEGNTAYSYFCPGTPRSVRCCLTSNSEKPASSVPAESLRTADEGVPQAGGTRVYASQYNDKDEHLVAISPGFDGFTLGYSLRFEGEREWTVELASFNAGFPKCTTKGLSGQPGVRVAYSLESRKFKTKSSPIVEPPERDFSKELSLDQNFVLKVYARNQSAAQLRCFYFMRNDFEQVYSCPLDARFSSGFGYRIDPFNGGRRTFHGGVDLSVDSGTAVFASNDGVVAVPSEDRRGYGNYVDVYHAQGRMTRYAHLSEIIVSEGDSVSQGILIARSGASGERITGPHLHFEYRVGNEPKNPADFVKTVLHPIGQRRVCRPVFQTTTG